MIDWHLTSYGWSGNWEDIRFTVENLTYSGCCILHVSMGNNYGYLGKNNRLSSNQHAHHFSSDQEAKQAADRYIKVRTLT